MTRLTTRALPLIACLALLVLAAPAASEDSHASLREFYATGEFDLIVDDKRVDAEILFSKRAAAYLITPATGKQTYLVLQRDRKVSLVGAALVRHENGNVDLPKGVALEGVGSVDLRKDVILIKAGSLRGRLTPRAPVLGRLTGAAVLAHSPQYGLILRGFKVNKDAVASLRKAADVTVETLFGSWCPRCQQQVGNALALESALGQGGIKFTYYGLPAPPDAWKDPRFLEHKVKGLPAALVFVKDKLVGRVGPNDWKHFDVALARVLSKQ